MVISIILIVLIFLNNFNSIDFIYNFNGIDFVYIILILLILGTLRLVVCMCTLLPQHMHIFVANDVIMIK